MKNKNWNIENVVKKWSPVIKSMGFKQCDVEKISEYAELHALTELADSQMLSDYPLMRPTAIDNPTPFKNLLPISLKVLEGINDLSKVHFTGLPAFELERNKKNAVETVKSHGMSISINREDYEDILSQTGVDVINRLESVIIQEVTKQLNKIIEEGNEIYMFLAVAGMRIISEETSVDPKLSIISRFHIEPISITIDDL